MLQQANSIMMKLFGIDNETAFDDQVPSTVANLDSAENQPKIEEIIPPTCEYCVYAEYSELQSELARRKKRTLRSNGKPGSKRRYESIMHF